MITTWFLGVWQSVSTWFLGFLPDVTSTHGIIVTATNWVSTLVAMGANLGAWIPWGVIGITLPIVFTLYGAIFLLKIVKNIWAFVPFFGGSG